MYDLPSRQGLRICAVAKMQPHRRITGKQNTRYEAEKQRNWRRDRESSLAHRFCACFSDLFELAVAVLSAAQVRQKYLHRHTKTCNSKTGDVSQDGSCPDFVMPVDGSTSLDG